MEVAACIPCNIVYSFPCRTCRDCRGLTTSHANLASAIDTMEDQCTVMLKSADTPVHPSETPDGLWFQNCK